MHMVKKNRPLSWSKPGGFSEEVTSGAKIEMLRKGQPTKRLKEKAYLALVGEESTCAKALRQELI